MRKQGGCKMKKEDFIDRRREIIDNLLEDERENGDGTYQQSRIKCFAQLDDLYDELADCELDVDPTESNAQKLRNTDEMVDLTTLDLTTQTITVGTQDDPTATLMKGHVDGLTFAKAWEKEGCDNPLGKNPTQEEIKEFEKGLEFSYAILNENNKHIEWAKEKNEAGAFPITVSSW